MQKKRSEPDWEAIEREYRSGQLSVREIARQHGISDTAIRKEAKKNGWVRNLANKVREQINSDLVREAVRAPNAREPEIVEAAAARGVEVVRSHRKDISSARSRTAKLGEQLDRLLGLIEGLDPKKDEGFSGFLGSAAKVNYDLAQATAKLIPLERQAFNLDEPDQSTGRQLIGSQQAIRMAQEVVSGGSAET